MTRKTMVVIPTYNEIDNVARVARAVLAQADDLHLLIVDDASPDGTGDAAEELARETDRVHVLHRTQKEGIGPAYIAGFRRALAWGAEAIGQMDADLSHNPTDLPRLINALDEGIDVAIGSRYVGGVRVLNWSAKRLALSLSASWYVGLVLGMPIEDPTGGFKLWRRQVLESLDLSHLTSKGYSFQIEMTYRALKSGFKVKEIPIVFHERERGGSKISKNIVYEALYVLWRIKLQRSRDKPSTTLVGAESPAKRIP